MKKACIISNILLSILYAVSSWIILILGYLLLHGNWSAGLSVEKALYYASALLLMATPLFCLAGIILSVIFRKREKYTLSFSIQFLPFISCRIAVGCLMLSMIIDGM